MSKEKKKARREAEKERRQQALGRQAESDPAGRSRKPLEVEIGLMALELLRPHEQILPFRLQEMIEKIQERGSFHKPLLVDRASLTILDGHHKYNAARALGLKRVPVALVDYLENEGIEVSTWPESGLESITKEDVVAMGRSEDLFPPKSSRHRIPFELPKLKIPLKKLR